MRHLTTILALCAAPWCVSASAQIPVLVVEITPDVRIAVDLESGLVRPVIYHRLEPPEPPTPDAWQVMFFHESDDLDDLPKEQQALLSGRAIRERLTEAGHVFLRSLDKDMGPDEEFAAWWAAVKGDDMPRVAIAPKDGGAIRDYPLPADEELLFLLLEDPNRYERLINSLDKSGKVLGEPKDMDPLDRETFRKEHYRLTPGSCGMLGCTIHGGGWVKQ